jgi:hypothetical protein
MQQDFYPAALMAELMKAPPAIEILAAPSPVEPEVPVHYSLRFTRDALNQVAALREWTLRWEFQDAASPAGEVAVTTSPSSAATAAADASSTETEMGWDIYHRFRAAGRHTVSVELVASNGDLIPTSKPIEIPVVMTASGRSARGSWWQPVSWTAEAKIEALRVAFVLIIALAGVFVGARQKVEQTGVFEGAAALLGIGFAADILKNALSDKPGAK